MNSMRSNNVWFDLIGGIAQELILEIFSDKKQDDKQENKPTPVEEEIEDLGYAVVVDDNGNEIKNYWKILFVSELYFPLLSTLLIWFGSNATYWS